MEHSDRPIWGEDPEVLSALTTAGWSNGRYFDSTAWVDSLEAAGFETSDLARRIWAEFGGLKILSSQARVPSSSLRIDPVDACIDSLDESLKLRGKHGINYSPLGMWSIQFRSYISESGRVIAVQMGKEYELGETFADAMEYVVKGVGESQPARWVD